MEINSITETRKFAGIDLRTRIGVDTGEVVAGNVGDGSRLTYTVIGKTVNTASRLEQLNKERGSKVIVSGNTASQLTRKYCANLIFQMHNLPVDMAPRIGQFGKPSITSNYQTTI